MQKLPPTSDMTLEQIYDNYKLSELIELAELECSHTWEQDYTHYIGLDDNKRTYEFKSVRTKYKITIKRKNETCIITFDQGKGLPVDYQGVVSCLRLDCDALFDVAHEKDYKKWRLLYREQFGEEGKQDINTFHTQLENYKKMKRVLQEWFPVLLYAEDDI